MKKYLDFSQEFGKVDEELIAEAGKPWTIKRGDIFRLYRRKIGQAAAILLAFITVAGNSHVQAAVKEFTTKIGELMGFSKDLSAYTEVINQVQTKSGISLTINEVILDNYSLIVSVKPDYEEKKKESLYLWINDEKTLINGKRYQSFSSTTRLMDLDSYTKYEMDTEMVLMQEYDGVKKEENVLSIRGMSKSFGRNRVLDHINLDVKRGTVMGLMGENGAGKSTMMKCLFGTYQKDEGSIFLDGKEVSFSGPKDALENGIAMVHQELNQCLERNVVDNLFLGRYPVNSMGIIDELVDAF